jgi:hypothetical protein
MAGLVPAISLQRSRLPLYRKTCANRQADLVKLVAGFSNPLTD